MFRCTRFAEDSKQRLSCVIRNARRVQWLMRSRPLPGILLYVNTDWHKCNGLKLAGSTFKISSNLNLRCSFALEAR